MVLPGELVREVFRWLQVAASQGKTGPAGSRTYYEELTRHTVICKAWLPYAREALFYHVAVQTTRPSHRSMIERLLEKKRLRKGVRVLEISSGTNSYPGRPDPATIVTLVRKLRMLRELRLDGAQLSLAESRAIGDALKKRKTVKVLYCYLEDHDTTDRSDDGEGPPALSESILSLIPTLAAELDLEELSISGLACGKMTADEAALFQRVRCRILSFRESDLCPSGDAAFLEILAQSLTVPVALGFYETQFADWDIEGAMISWGTQLQVLHIDCRGHYEHLGLDSPSTIIPSCPNLSSLSIRHFDEMTRHLETVPASVRRFELDWVPESEEDPDSGEDSDDSEDYEHYRNEKGPCFFRRLREWIVSTGVSELVIWNEARPTFWDEKEARTTWEWLRSLRKEAAKLDTVCRERGVAQTPVRYEAMLVQYMRYVEGEGVRLEKKAKEDRRKEKLDRERGIFRSPSPDYASYRYRAYNWYNNY